MNLSETSRRSFLLAAGGAAVSVVAGSTATAFAANETINVGVIGSGGRARYLMKSFPSLDKVRIIAVCDIWEAALAEGKKLADPQAATTRKYQEILDNKDVHAVLIGSPDHWHVPLTIAALAAGKDVYVEKRPALAPFPPGKVFTHDLGSGRDNGEAETRTED